KDKYFCRWGWTRTQGFCPSCRRGNTLVILPRQTPRPHLSVSAHHLEAVARQGQLVGARHRYAGYNCATRAAFPGLMDWERRMWKLKRIGRLMTIVFWGYALILVYSVLMSIFRYTLGVQLPNPFSIFQAR